MRPPVLNRLLCLMFSWMFLGHSLQADSLLSNGNFETGTDSPKDWPVPEGASWMEEAGNHFLRLSANPTRMLTVYRVIPIQPGMKALQVRFKVRVQGLERGKENWHDGRIILDFKDAQGMKLKGASHPSFKGTSQGWTDRSLEFLIPEGATQLEIMPAIFMARTGHYDLDDLEIVHTDPTPIQARMEEAARKKALDIAKRAAKVQPQVPKTPAHLFPPQLHVQGNQILDDLGQPVWLQGVSIPSLEWSASGDHILESTRVALQEWKANLIRLSIREHFWKGTGPYQADGGAAYRQLIDDVVNLVAAHRAYLVLDLHRFRAPEKVHVDFWKELGALYRNHPAVLFEIFNEPHDLSWEVWRNGGFVSTQKSSGDEVIPENQESLKGFQSVGIQALIQAIRSQGASNLVIAGGLDWSYDLSGILKGFALDDLGGHGIVYSTHVYPWKSDWTGKFMEVAEQHPIFIGECGASQERMSFIPPEQHEDPSTWVPDFLGLVQKHRYHWAAWCFHPKSSPCLLTDWDYTPTPYWGVHAKAALAGQPFPLGKSR